MAVFEKSKRRKAAAVIGIVLFLAAAAALSSRTGWYLTLRNRDTHEVYARYRMREGDRFSITFIHSVNLYPLTDTYEICDGTIYVEECKYYAYGAGVQTELRPGETMTCTDDGAMLISGIHQDRTNVGYIVGTVYDHVLSVNGEEISLRDLCGRNAAVRFNYEFWLL